VIRHYHWIVLYDFLPRVLDRGVLDEVMTKGSTAFDRRGPFMPVEFSAAAYRFGHSIVPERLDVNASKRDVTLDKLFLHAAAAGDAADVPVPTGWIADWRCLFQLDPERRPSPSRRIDPYLAPTLAKLTGHENPSLAFLNLKRGVKVGLPSGQSVAKLYGYEPLTAEEIGDSGEDGLVAKETGLNAETPLWYYILKEAQIQAAGLRLGLVGSRIVADTIIGLLESDSTSFLCRDRRWTPHLPAEVKGAFTMPDLVRYATEAMPDGKLPEI
jgi:hypothetical protein